MKLTEKLKEYFAYLECKRWILLTATLFCLIFGLILGIVLRGVNEKWIELINKSMENIQWIERDKMYFGFIGNMYIRLIQLVLMPMVISHIISDIGTISFTFQKKMTLIIMGYYILTLFLASAITISTFLIIKPGSLVLTNVSDDNIQPGSLHRILPEDIFLDIFRNIIPDNIMVATFNSTKTVLLNNTEIIVEDDRDLDFKITMIEAPNLLGLISCCIVFGAGARYCCEFCDQDKKEKVGVVLNIFMDVAVISDNILCIIIWLTPFGIGSIMVSEILQTKDVNRTLIYAAWYILSFLIVYVIHALIVIPSLFWIITRKSPFRLLKIMCPALVTALITASSMAANHEMGVCLEKYGVSNRVKGFLFPLRLVIQLDSYALYEGSAVLFLAQMEGRGPSVVDSILLVVIVVLSSIGITVPMATFVILSTCLDIGGISEQNIGIILVVDWVVDRLRTAFTVFANSCAAVIAHNYLEVEDDLSAVEQANGAEGADSRKKKQLAYVGVPLYKTTLAHRAGHV